MSIKLEFTRYPGCCQITMTTVVILALPGANGYIFLEMIDNLLPHRICQTREKIRKAIARLKGSTGSGQPAARFGSKRAGIDQLLADLKPLAESYNPGQKESFELLWLVEEVAAGFPKKALAAAVWWSVIIPVLKRAGLDRTLSEPPGEGRTAPDESPLAYNHLFLPPPASRTLKLLGTQMVGRSGAEDDLGQCFPVFDLPAPNRMLIPAAARADDRPGAGVVYYLVEDEGLSLETGPVSKWPFPFRPAKCRMSSRKVSTRKIEPILDLRRDQFQAGLEDYFLMLAAVFSGWARAGWQGLVRKKQSGHFSPELDTEISFLATEIGLLQHKLLHLSHRRSFSGCRFGKVEKLCLKGLHLASRAWRHSLACFLE